MSPPLCQGTHPPPPDHGNVQNGRILVVWEFFHDSDNQLPVHYNLTTIAMSSIGDNVLQLNSVLCSVNNVAPAAHTSILLARNVLIQHLPLQFLLPASAPIGIKMLLS